MKDSQLKHDGHLSIQIGEWKKKKIDQLIDKTNDQFTKVPNNYLIMLRMINNKR